ncbi:hypothetical protein [Amycolatopsis sp. VC5-11]|uniref:hypothetical protein n=1 Tax=Amycolatopsis sp. VC5-11 TaxID=3120156 RepID=UPI003008F730
MATFIVDGVEQLPVTGESVYPKIIFNREFGLLRVEFDDVDPDTAQSWGVVRQAVVARADGVPAGVWYFLQGYVPPLAEETEPGS